MVAARKPRSLAAIRSELANAEVELCAQYDDNIRARLQSIVDRCTAELNALGAPGRVEENHMTANLDGGGPRREMRRKAWES
jgi:hypothetical protein